MGLGEGVLGSQTQLGERMGRLLVETAVCSRRPNKHLAGVGGCLST